MFNFNPTIWDTLMTAYKLKRMELDVAKESRKLLKEFKKIEGLSKRLDYEVPKCRYDGIIDMLKIKSICIKVADGEIECEWQLTDGTFLNDTPFISKSEVKDLSNKIAGEHMKDLLNTRDYYEKELALVKQTIDDAEKILIDKELPKDDGN